MKRRIFFFAVVAICLAILTVGTAAFFTSEDQVHNVITTNGVDIEIEEWQQTPDGLQPYPQDKPIELMPGVTVSKIATIKNLEADAWIRAKFEVVIKDENKQVMDLSPETLASIITVPMNEDEWLRKDGDSEWWYYHESVKEGETTEPLFSEVIFDGPNMTNEYQNCTVELTVIAKAVQSANNGDSALEASGWSAE